MKKAFFITIVVFISIAAVLLSIETEWNDSISILTLNQAYSRLMNDEDEVVSIPVYLSETDTFLVDVTVIESAVIDSDETQMEVTVFEIRYANEEILDGKKYHLYYYDLKFPLNIESNDFMSFVSANLSLTYANGDQISMEIGNLFLRFGSINQALHLDLYRMGAIHSTYNNKDYISGLYLGLQNLTGCDIHILQIDIGLNSIRTDLDASIFVNYVPETSQTLDELLGYPYESNEYQLHASVLVEDNRLWIIPLHFDNEIEQLYRFPMIITYTYQEQEYEYVIDDFLFRQPDYSLEANGGSIRETLYLRP